MSEISWSVAATDDELYIGDFVLVCHLVAVICMCASG